jgi:hypothetical protein
MPDSPATYARAAFDAWHEQDAETIITLAEPATAQLLLARDPADEAWSSEPLCEGAAGSTYCTWSAEDVQLQLRVSNESAATMQPHAVTEAAFVPNPGDIAIWPLATQEEADTTQISVDEGHSPWMLDAATVGSAFAGAVLGWADAIVEPMGGSTYRVYDRATGVAVEAEIVQPVREGAGGIWVVSRLVAVTGNE